MSDIAAKITTLSRWIDDSYPADVQGTETHMRRRVDKLIEEVGEVGQALGGMWGENPRKGFTHGVEDVKDELLDVAITALGAWVHCEDEFDVMEALDSKLNFILERVGLSVATSQGVAPHGVAPVDVESRRGSAIVNCEDGSSADHA